MATLTMRQGGSASLLGRRILVVDDSHDAADALSRLLRLGGHQVQVAYSGEVALLMAKQHKQDVVLLDLGLPRMDGYRVCERLREMPEAKEALIIAVTGYGDASARERSKEAGFDLHLLKPIETEKLLGFLKGDPTLLMEN